MVSLHPACTLLYKPMWTPYTQLSPLLGRQGENPWKIEDGDGVVDEDGTPHTNEKLMMIMAAFFPRGDARTTNSSPTQWRGRASLFRHLRKKIPHNSTYLVLRGDRYGQTDERGGKVGNVENTYLDKQCLMRLLSEHKSSRWFTCCPLYSGKVTRDASINMTVKTGEKADQSC